MGRENPSGRRRRLNATYRYTAPAMKTSLKAISVVLALVLVLVLSACGGDSKADSAATVNGVSISNERLAKVEPVVRALLKANNQSCSPDGSESDDCSAFALTLMVQAEVVRQAAEDAAATATEVNEVMDEFTQQFSQGDEAALGKMLADGGATMDGLRDLANIQVLMQNAQETLSDQGNDEALKQLYEQDKSQFATIDTSHILLKTEQEADDLLPKVTQEDFNALAKKFSTDPSAKENGGDLGPIPATQLVADYSNAVLAAEEGQIIGPVKSDFGWHIIWVKGIDIPPFEEVKSQLEQQGPQDAFQIWLDKQIADADIEVNPRYGKLDPATGQVVPVSSTSAEVPQQSPTQAP